MLREKDYLSWSQYSLWTKSKREYWKRYGLNENRSSNKFFAKGKELSEALDYDDDGSNSTDELLSMVLQNIPRLDFQEVELKVQLKNGETLLSYVDSGCLDFTEFYEYKTGKIPWTQELVDKHDQMLFYALGYYIKSERTLIPTSKLIWVETEQTETEGLKYTGLIQEFNRSFTVEEVEAFEDTLIAAIEEIENWDYVELELEDNLVDRYIELTELVKQAEAELDLIKLEVQLMMDAEEVQYANATNGKFSIAERKTWTYSASFVKVKSDIDKRLKIAMAQEQKDGIAKQTVSKSLKFSLNK